MEANKLSLYEISRAVRYVSRHQGLSREETIKLKSRLMSDNGYVFGKKNAPSARRKTDEEIAATRRASSMRHYQRENSKVVRQAWYAKNKEKVIQRGYERTLWQRAKRECEFLLKMHEELFC